MSFCFPTNNRRQITETPYQPKHRSSDEFARLVIEFEAISKSGHEVDPSKLDQLTRDIYNYGKHTRASSEMKTCDGMQKKLKDIKLARVPNTNNDMGNLSHLQSRLDNLAKAIKSYKTCNDWIGGNKELKLIKAELERLSIPQGKKSQELQKKIKQNIIKVEANLRKNGSKNVQLMVLIANANDYIIKEKDSIIAFKGDKNNSYFKDWQEHLQTYYDTIQTMHEKNSVYQKNIVLRDLQDLLNVLSELAQKGENRKSKIQPDQEQNLLLQKVKEFNKYWNDLKPNLKVPVKNDALQLLHVIRDGLDEYTQTDSIDRNILDLFCTLETASPSKESEFYQRVGDIQKQLEQLSAINDANIQNRCATSMKNLNVLQNLYKRLNNALPINQIIQEGTTRKLYDNNSSDNYTLRRLDDVEKRVNVLGPILEAFKGSKQEGSFISLDADFNSLMNEIDKLSVVKGPEIKQRCEISQQKLIAMIKLYDEKVAEAQEKEQKHSILQSLSIKLRKLNMDIDNGRTDKQHLNKELIALSKAVIAVDLKGDGALEEIQKGLLDNIRDSMNRLATPIVGHNHPPAAKMPSKLYNNKPDGTIVELRKLPDLKPKQDAVFSTQNKIAAISVEQQNAYKQLDEIAKKVDALLPTMKKFTGSKLEDTYYTLDADITSLMSDIDKLAFLKDAEVKERRKQLLKKLNALAEEYDDKCANAPKTISDQERSIKMNDISTISDKLGNINRKITGYNAQTNHTEVDNLLIEVFKEANAIETKKDDKLEESKKALIKSIQASMYLLANKVDEIQTSSAVKVKPTPPIKPVHRNSREIIDEPIRTSEKDIEEVLHKSQNIERRLQELRGMMDTFTGAKSDPNYHVLDTIMNQLITEINSMAKYKDLNVKKKHRQFVNELNSISKKYNEKCKAASVSSGNNRTLQKIKNINHELNKVMSEINGPNPNRTRMDSHLFQLHDDANKIEAHDAEVAIAKKTLIKSIKDSMYVASQTSTEQFTNASLDDIEKRIIDLKGVVMSFTGSSSTSTYIDKQIALALTEIEQIKDPSLKHKRDALMNQLRIITDARDERQEVLRKINTLSKELQKYQLEIENFNSPNAEIGNWLLQLQSKAEDVRIKNDTEMEKARSALIAKITQCRARLDGKLKTLSTQRNLSRPFQKSHSVDLPDSTSLQLKSQHSVDSYLSLPPGQPDPPKTPTKRNYLEQINLMRIELQNINRQISGFGGQSSVVYKELEQQLSGLTSKVGDLDSGNSPQIEQEKRKIMGEIKYSTNELSKKSNIQQKIINMREKIDALYCTISSSDVIQKGHKLEQNLEQVEIDINNICSLHPKMTKEREELVSKHKKCIDLYNHKVGLMEMRMFKHELTKTKADGSNIIRTKTQLQALLKKLQNYKNLTSDQVFEDRKLLLNEVQQTLKNVEADAQVQNQRMSINQTPVYSNVNVRPLSISSHPAPSDINRRHTIYKSPNLMDENLKQLKQLNANLEMIKNGIDNFIGDEIQYKMITNDLNTTYNQAMKVDVRGDQTLENYRADIVRKIEENEKQLNRKTYMFSGTQV